MLSLKEEHSELAHRKLAFPKLLIYEGALSIAEEALKQTNKHASSA